MRTYENMWKIAIGQGDDYTTDCLSDYNYFNNYFKMIIIDLSKELALADNQKRYNKIILQEI